MGSGASRTKKTCPNSIELSIQIAPESCSLIEPENIENVVESFHEQNVSREMPLEEREEMKHAPEDMNIESQESNEPLLMIDLVDEKVENWGINTNASQSEESITIHESHFSSQEPTLTKQDQTEFLSMISKERLAIEQKERQLRSDSYRLKTELQTLKEMNEEYKKTIQESDEKMIQMRQELVQLRKQLLDSVPSESKQVKPNRPPAYPQTANPPFHTDEDRMKKLEKKVAKLRHVLGKERLQHAVKIFELETEIKAHLPPLKRPSFDPVSLELEQQIKNRNQIILDLSMRLNEVEEQLNKTKQESSIAGSDITNSKLESTWSTRWSCSKHVPETSDALAVAL